MGEGGLGQDLESGIIINGITDQATAVSVVSVFAEADIGHYREFRGLVFQLLDSSLNDAILGMGTGAHGILLLRQTEEDDGIHPKLQTFLCLVCQLVHTHPEDTGHGGDFFPFVFSRHDKEGIDKLGW